MSAIFRVASLAAAALSMVSGAAAQTEEAAAAEGSSSSGADSGKFATWQTVTLVGLSVGGVIFAAAVVAITRHVRQRRASQAGADSGFQPLLQPLPTATALPPAGPLLAASSAPTAAPTSAAGYTNVQIWRLTA